MKRVVVPIISTALLISMVCSSSVYAANEQIDTSDNVGVQYKTHIQDKGWESNWVGNGDLSGTVGEGKRLEGLKVELVGSFPVTANIQTYVHVQNKGDMGPFPMGNMAGTEGQGLRLESIRMVLNNLSGYTIKYNVQVQNKGWLRDEDDDTTWFNSGETAGTAGQSLRLEGIRIKIVQIDENLLAYNAALAAVNEYEYTISSWSDYQVVVAENVVDADNTVDEIKQATKNIIAAQGNLVKGKTMSGYVAALQAVSEADYTPASWAEYQLVVENNVVDQSNSQSEINIATLNIMDAQRQLQHKLNLTEYEKTLAAVRESDYTAPSWAVYQKVLAANVMTEANTQVQVATAVEKIKLAQKKMVRKFDFTAYNTLLKAVKEDDYIASTWSLYQVIVDDNKVDENDTQSDIEAAITKIEAAQKQLIKKADLKYYQAALDAVKKDDYTTASWNAYQKAISTIIVNPTSKQEVVDAAIKNILESQKSLVPAADMTYYEAVKEMVSRDDYTSASWLAYQKVVDANVVIPTDGQEAVNTAIQNIEAAQKKLVKGANLDAYEELLKAVSSDTYTSVSWDKYQKVISSNVMTGDKTQDQVDAAIEKIRVAQKALVKRGDLTLAGGYNETVKAKNELEYTTASWAAYQKVLDANYMDADKSQVQIDAAVLNIKKAQLKLAKSGDLTKYTTLIETNKNLGIPMVEGQYTSASWAIYQKILDKNEMNRDKTQAQIDAAVVAIERAQKNLKLRGTSAMVEYRKTLDAVKKDDYTVKSWTAYMKVVMNKDNYMTGDNDEAAILKAIGNIDLAQTTVLVKKGDVTAYNNLIASFQNMQDSYQTTPWNNYLSVLAKNIRTTENTQDEIQAAITFISAAQDELRKYPAAWNYPELVKQLAEVDDKSAYTPQSWLDYQAIIRQYQTYSKDTSVKDIATAIGVISKAQLNTLRRVNGIEITAFKKTLELYQKNFIGSGDYKLIQNKIKNWSVYEQAVNKYASFYEDYSWKPSFITDASSKEEIVKATKEIDTAIRALRPIDSLGLNDAITDYLAEKDKAILWDDPIIALDYTKDSYIAYSDKCRSNDIPNFIINSSGLIKVDYIKTAQKGIADAMLYSKPLYRAKSEDIKNYRDQETWWQTSRPADYTDDSWTKFNEKWKTIIVKYPDNDLNNPENIVRENIVNDTNTVMAFRSALIYKASYVLEKAQITASTMTPLSAIIDVSERGDVQHNVLAKAKLLITSSGLDNFNLDNYDVAFVQVAGKGTAIIETDGAITDKGDGKATVKIYIQVKNSPSSKVDTGELILTIN